MGPIVMRTGRAEVSTTRNFIVCIVYLVRVIKSRNLRWVGHVARIKEGRSAFKILTGKPIGN